MPGVNPVLQLFNKRRAILDGGHFVGPSGRHSPLWIQKDAVYCHPADTAKLGELIAGANQGRQFDAVAAPAMGGVLISAWAAHFLSEMQHRDVVSVFTDKSGRQQALGRGYDKVVRDRRVLIIEDITMTGSSAKQTAEQVTLAGGQVIGVCALINRDPKRVNSTIFGVPYQSLAIIEAQSFDPTQCPLCRDRLPINTDFAHGREFLSNPAPTPE